MGDPVWSGFMSFAQSCCLAAYEAIQVGTRVQTVWFVVSQIRVQMHQEVVVQAARTTCVAFVCKVERVRNTRDDTKDTTKGCLDVGLKFSYVGLK